ncbi:AAA family ATPase [Halomicroarcula sp. F13]|uniref:AAA family ATPase n=1 Tax=Haloarcula rubra TaxID=2487747 RepID=A0AAW4PWE5_9EURY|nr:archaea-specific SMC-related protein [Halomicroarcula rubra]MBX0324434.1 AAA family ATPase [Halomicroarcula rubra]
MDTTNNNETGSRAADDYFELRVENIGGIEDAELTITEGVTLLSGRNASNKSSLLRSLAGVLGGPLPPLKSDAEVGRVSMTLHGTEFHVELGREGSDTVVRSADLFSSADDLCELFVALTETNPIRQAVLADEDLYEYLMRPVDTDAIESEIRRLTDEKQALDDRLAELDSMENRLPGLRTRENSLREELADVEAELQEKRDAIETLEAEADGGDGETEALREKRSERNDLRQRISSQEAAIEELRSELETVTEQLEATEGDDPETDVADLDAELETLHQQKQRLTSTINALSPIVEMNSQVLDESADIPSAMRSDDIVSELDPASQTITCWTCGSTVERAEIADQVEAVKSIVQEKRAERDAVTDRIQRLSEQKRELEQRRESREELRARREDIQDEIERRETTLESLESDRRALETEIEALQRNIDDASADDEQLATYYDAVSDLEYERGQLASDLERIESEIAEVEAALAERADIEADRDAVATELQAQRDRIDELERDLVSTFNETMQHVLDTLEYDSIERIWLERRSSGDRITSETEFEIHVVRATEDGTAYDDTVDSLSKSEREVIGLIVALAGYLVHDVAEEVPFIVVDAVEMFDAERIHGLMQHFGESADYVVTAVLPEERAQLDGRYDTISTQSFVADS